MNSTILAIILVLLSSVGLGLFTGLVSFNLGSESLKGVKSPTVSNTKKTNGKESDKLTPRKKFEFIEEKTILVKVYDHVHRHRQASQKQKQASKKD